MSEDFNVRNDFREKNIKIKALEVVQGLGMLYADGKKDLKSAEHVIEQMYKCVHVALGDCENPHDEWMKGLDEIYESFRGIYVEIDQRND